MCFDTIDTPADLRCGHPLCESCLKYMRIANVKRVCPICQEDTLPSSELQESYESLLAKMQEVIGDWFKEFEANGYVYSDKIWKMFLAKSPRLLCFKEDMQDLAKKGNKDAQEFMRQSDDFDKDLYDDAVKKYGNSVVDHRLGIKSKGTLCTQMECSNCGSPEGTVPGTPRHKACGRCKRAYYCGPSCQKHHWKHGGHKALCGR